MIKPPALACFILSLGLLLVFGGYSMTAAQGTPTPTPAQPVRECAECHLDIVAGWQDSAHARAYSDPAFQAAWQEKAQDKTCLACHTTGFNARTGDYAQQGVACEACHGQTPTDHPPQAVAINKGIETCAGCHTTTVNEWKLSKHGEQQLACTTCHIPHPQTLRFAEKDELCLNCHKEQPVGYAHETHRDQMCVDCHWYRGISELHAQTGDLIPTGHDNQVETRTCTDCHADLAAKNAGAEPQPTPIRRVEAIARLSELETQVKSVRAEAENTALMRILEGAALGLVLGGGVMFLVMGLAYRPKKTATLQETAGSDPEKQP